MKSKTLLNVKIIQQTHIPAVVQLVIDHVQYFLVILAMTRIQLNGRCTIMRYLSVTNKCIYLLDFGSMVYAEDVPRYLRDSIKLEPDQVFIIPLPLQLVLLGVELPLPMKMMMMRLLWLTEV